MDQLIGVFWTSGVRLEVYGDGSLATAVKGCGYWFEDATVAATRLSEVMGLHFEPQDLDGQVKAIREARRKLWTH